MSQTKPRSDLEVQLAQFDYDTPVEEWPDDDIQELLDLVEELDCSFADTLARYRSGDWS